MGTFRLLAAMLALCALAASAATLEEDALRRRGAAAFERGDYDAMARAYEPLAAKALADVKAAGGDSARLMQALWRGLDDALGVGHAHQLAGRYAQAVAAYENALLLREAHLHRFLEARAKADADPAKAKRPGVRGPSRFEDQQAASYAELVTLIGCLQRDELKDLAAAAATFAKGPRFTPPFTRDLNELAQAHLDRLRQALKEETGARTEFRDYSSVLPALRTERELAATQERAGKAAEALETWRRANLIALLYDIPEGAEAGALARLIQKLPENQPLPPTPGLIVLSPKAPGKSLKLDDPQALAEACKVFPIPANPLFHFAFAPSPGLEFATLSFECEMVTAKGGANARLSCWTLTAEEPPARLPIGMLEWPRDAPPGRQTVVEDFPVPPGAEAARIEIMQSRERFVSVAVKATFRPRQDPAKLPPKDVPKAPVTVRTEVMPNGGQLDCNGKKVDGFTFWRGVPPGRYSFVYSVPGRLDVFRAEADFQSGSEYGLFVNLDSPFEWTLTNLRHLAERPPAPPSLARLADGRWLVAYAGTNSKIMLSVSQDAAALAEPWPLSHGSIFDAKSPSLYVDPKGTIWLTYISNRLTWPGEHGYYRAWLTSSRDGRDWSPPRPICMGPLDDTRPPWSESVLTDLGAFQMLQGPGARCWMFWSRYAASADTPEGIHRLVTTTAVGTETGINAMLNTVLGTSVAVDAKGRFHMLFSPVRSGLRYSTSADGHQWSPPVTLAERKENGPLPIGQLVLDGDEAALISDDGMASWLRRGKIEPAPQFGPPIKISNYTVPLHGSRPCVAPDGKVFLLAGKDSVWLLKTDLKHLLRATQQF